MLFEGFLNSFFFSLIYIRRFLHTIFFALLCFISEIIFLRIYLSTSYPYQTFGIFILILMQRYSLILEVLLTRKSSQRPKFIIVFSLASWAFYFVSIAAMLSLMSLFCAKVLLLSRLNY
jgi:hypothetical protein